MLNITIRNEHPKDYYAAELVAKRAFWNLHVPGCNEHYLVHILRESNDYIPSLTRVAECDGKIVGAIYYAKCKIETSDGEIPVLTFGPLCVDPDYQRRGIGKALLEASLSQARQMPFAAVIIFGEPKYYPRHGFVTCDKMGITTADGENSDAFMCLELHDGALSSASGRFIEASVYYNLPEQSVEEYDLKFPYMEKLVLPGQWGQPE